MALLALVDPSHYWLEQGGAYGITFLLHVSETGYRPKWDVPIKMDPPCQINFSLELQVCFLLYSSYFDWGGCDPYLQNSNLDTSVHQLESPIGWIFGIVQAAQALPLFKQWSPCKKYILFLRRDNVHAGLAICSTETILSKILAKGRNWCPSNNDLQKKITLNFQLAPFATDLLWLEIKYYTLKETCCVTCK